MYTVDDNRTRNHEAVIILRIFMRNCYCEHEANEVENILKELTSDDNFKTYASYMTDDRAKTSIDRWYQPGGPSWYVSLRIDIALFCFDDLQVLERRFEACQKYVKKYVDNKMRL